MEQRAVIKIVGGQGPCVTEVNPHGVFADFKNSASECNESSLSKCRAQPILSKSLYSSSADDISAGTGKNSGGRLDGAV